MHSMQKSNSRQDVIPGQREAQDEAIRSQLLIGKLKASDRWPGADASAKYFGRAAIDHDQTHESVSSNLKRHSRDVAQTYHGHQG